MEQYKTIGDVPIGTEFTFADDLIMLKVYRKIDDLWIVPVKSDDIKIRFYAVTSQIEAKTCECCGATFEQAKSRVAAEGKPIIAFTSA